MKKGTVAVIFIFITTFSFCCGQLSEVCMGCICEGVSLCDKSLGCHGDVCGLFRITWPYWQDAGAPLLPGDEPSTPDAYQRCTNDPVCAGITVRNYMAHYGQDCNGDGVINCNDYLAIHVLGGYNCTGIVKPAIRSKYENCKRKIATFMQGGSADFL